jgi:phage recombination protein Bet
MTGGTMEAAIVRSEGAVLGAAQGPWTRERIDLVKRTIVPKEIDDDAFALFMEQCKRSGLDPLLKEAFCVPRKQKVGESYVTKHEFQPSEAGMLARADRFPDFGGIQASAVFAEDEIVMDLGKGEVVHRFNPAKRKGVLVGAWARVVRDGKLPVVVWLDFSGYVQQTPLWAKIPTTMIEKCARVAALRKGYPEAFGGLYVKEEMPAEEYPGEEETPRTRAAPKALPSPIESEPPPQTGPSAAPRPALSATVVAFGPHKGKTFSELGDAEISETIDMAHEKLLEQPKAKWAKAMRENLAALEDEVGRRMARNGEEHRKAHLVGIDPWKSMPIGDLSDEQLGQAVDKAQSLLDGEPTAQHRGIRRVLGMLEEECASRANKAKALMKAEIAGAAS